MVVHVSRELEPVETARHIDVREHHLNVGSLIEDEHCIVCSKCFNHRKSGLFENIDGEEADQHLILDYENDGGRCASIIHLTSHPAVPHDPTRAESRNGRSVVRHRRSSRGSPQ